MQNGITKKEQRNMDTLYRAKPYIPEVTHQWILRKFGTILETGGLIQGAHVKEFEDDGQSKELEMLAVKVRNGDIPPKEVFEHFENDEFLRFFKNKYRKEIHGMSPDYLRKIGYKKPTKKVR